jgi:L-ascorbate metabolism protein UlaG (beta-lactamase superfamily)
MKIGEVELHFLGHSGFLIIGKDGRRIVIDPYNVSDKVEKVDIILITHAHYDHCSIKDIQKLARSGCMVVGTPDVQSKLVKVENIDMQIAEVGDKLELSGVKLEAVAAYNVNKEFHPKREGWLGYVIKMGNVVIYHSGDSDKIPEMKKLTGYGKHGSEFVMLLPVSGKYVMDAEEAAEVASLISPDIVIPMHYGAGVAGTIEDAKRFVEICKGSGLKSEVLEKI